MSACPGDEVRLFGESLIDRTGRINGSQVIRARWGTGLLLALGLLFGGCAEDPYLGRTVSEIVIREAADIAQYQDVAFVSNNVYIYDFAWPEDATTREILLPKLIRVDGNFEFGRTTHMFDDPDYRYPFPHIENPTVSIKFPSLQYIGGSLVITRTQELNSLLGFSQLWYLGEGLRIERCLKLRNLDGLEHLSEIGGSLILGNNPELKSYAGLSGVRRVGFDIDADESGDEYYYFEPRQDGLYIFNDAGVQALGQLEVTAVAGHVGLSGDVGATIGLTKLQYVEGVFGLYDSPVTSLQGLSLFHLGALELVNNNQLENIDALSTLTRLDFLHIGGQKPSSLEALANITEAPQGITISNSPIANLAELRSLESLGGLWLYNAKFDFASLDKFEEIGAAGLGIVSSTVESFHGLDNLRRIHGPFRLEGGRLGGTFENLGKLEYIGSHMKILHSGNVLDFSGLEKLKEIAGGLFVSDNTNLVNFEGLNGLESIAGAFSVMDNDNLVNFVGLIGLESVAGLFAIHRNKNLVDFEGLSGLQSIAGGFRVDDNYNLVNFEGLSKLKSVAGGFLVEYSENLANFHGLGELNSVEGGFSVTYNTNLVNFEGLNGLERIAGGLSVDTNDAMINFYGLDGLEHIDGSVVVYNNLILEDIEAISGASLSGSDLFEFSSNDSLCDSLARNVAEAMGAQNVNIFSNKDC